MNTRGRNRTLTRAVLVAFSVLAALIASAGVASAHFSGYDSVQGRRILYADYTRYDDEREFGVRQWNDLGSVAIKPGGTDLEFRDYRDCGDGLYGYYLWRSGASDQIDFNICVMNRHNRIDRRGTAVHELGHALGLAHNNDRGSIMYGGGGSLPFDKPQAHDRRDYYELWPRRGSSTHKRHGRAKSVAGQDRLEARYAFDAKDTRKLAGAATNVFSGRVVEQSGSEGAKLSGPD